MKILFAVLLANWMVTTPANGDKVVDSFIRDGVKPNDFEKITPNARKGRTHLASFGTGFFITKNGYILMNHHVVENAAELVVVRGDVAYRAFVVAQNQRNDLALLKINLFPRGTNGVCVVNGIPVVPCLPLSRGCEIGQTAFAVGFPRPRVLGFEPKVTRGIVCSMTGYEGRKDNFQMDAILAPGNSGGPVVDEYGNVIGVSVSGAHGASVGANYAINMDTVRKFIPRGVGYESGVVGRRIRTEKMMAKVIDSVVLILNYGEGACERITRTETDCDDVRTREAETKIRKAVLDARLCKLKKEWKELKAITDWILEMSGEVGDVREWNDMAREELGLHLIIRAEADGRDVNAVVKPICGFKDDFVVCGRTVPLYGGRDRRGFPVEARLEFEDDEWKWRGELKCIYDWRGTKEICVVLKHIGKK